LKLVILEVRVGLYAPILLHILQPATITVECEIIKVGVIELHYTEMIIKDFKILELRVTV